MSIKDIKTFDEDPPPYTAQPSEPATAPSTIATDASVVVTLKHHKPANLWNAQGCQIQRSGPANSSILDAVRLHDSFVSLLSEIRQRAAQRFSLSTTEIETGGKLAYRPDKDETGSEKAKRKAEGVMAIDCKNWEAVRVLLALGKGELEFEVEDVPIGWMIVKVKSTPKAKPETKGNKGDGGKKGTCAVM